MCPHDHSEITPFDITIPELPPRSRLFALPPIGIGTDHMEGLGSYVTRLARAHAVKPWRLLKEEFDKDGRLRHFWELARYKITLDGLGLTARIMSAIAAELTTVAEVRYLTLLPLADLLPVNGTGLLAKEVRWCPSCFAAMNRDGQEPYRPLVWSFARYTVCHRHRVPLVAVCGHCGKKQKFLPDYPDLIHCCHCGCSLADRSGKARAVRGASLDLWVATSIGDLVAHFPELDGSPIRAQLAKYLNDAINDLADGKRWRFFTKLGLSAKSLDKVLYHEGHVRLLRFLALAYGMNISPAAMLLRGSEPPQELRLVPLRLRQEGKLRPLTKQRKQQIHDALASVVADPNDTRSGLRVSDSLGVAAHRLMYWFPVEYSAICARHAQAKKQATAERKASECEVVREAVRRVVSRGVFPSLRQVAREVKPHHLALVRKDLMEAYHRTVKECVSTIDSQFA